MNWAIALACMLVVLYLAYCARLFCLGFANVRREGDAYTCRQTILLSLLAFDRCDCESVLLCETQRHVLEILDKTHQGLSLRRMRSEFASLSAEYPELFDGYQFSNWLEVLRTEGVIECDGRRVRITERGVAILEGLECRADQPCSEVAARF
jgi:hypothetical protein